MTEIVRVAWEIANAPHLNPQARIIALREIRERKVTYSKNSSMLEF